MKQLVAIAAGLFLGYLVAGIGFLLYMAMVLYEVEG